MRLNFAQRKGITCGSRVAKIARSRSRAGSGGPLRRTGCAASASGNRVEFHRREDRGICRQPKGSQVFPIEMQPDRFANVLGQLIESGCLSNDRQIKALSEKLMLAPADSNLDCPFHRRPPSVCIRLPTSQRRSPRGGAASRLTSVPSHRSGKPFTLPVTTGPRPRLGSIRQRRESAVGLRILRPPCRRNLRLDLIHRQLTEPRLRGPRPRFVQPVRGQIQFNHLPGVLLSGQSSLFRLRFQRLQIRIRKSDGQVQRSCSSPPTVPDHWQIVQNGFCWEDGGERATRLWIAGPSEIIGR
jgi:hypothetical protein